MSNIGKIHLINYATGGHFDEILSSIRETLSQYLPVEYKNTPQEDGYNIIFGLNAYLMINPGWPILPKNSIIFNLEQLGHNWLWDSTNYLSYLLNYRVIDYSQENIKYLRNLGKKDIYFLPIRWHKNFSINIPIQKKEYDVLLIGSQSPRRVAILNELRKSGLIVAHASDIWGDARANIISKSKIVLNLHNNHYGLLETTRLTILIASQVPVISESSSDKYEDDFFSQFITIKDFSNLIEETINTVKSEKWINYYSEAIMSIFRSESIDKYISSIISHISSERSDKQFTIEDIFTIRQYLTQKNLLSNHTNLIPIIDYALHWSDRTHEIEDYFTKLDNIDNTPLVLLLELIESTWIPDYLSVSIVKGIIKKISSNEYTRLSEHGKKLACKILAIHGEVFLYLRIICSSNYPLNLTKETIHYSHFYGLAVSNACSSYINNSELASIYKNHITAELLWHMQQNSHAVLEYLKPSARTPHVLDTDHLKLVASRLFQYGHYISALTFYNLANILAPDFVIQAATKDANTMTVKGESREPPSNTIIEAILERNYCFSSSQIEHKGCSNFYIDTSDHTSALLDSGIKIYEKNFPKYLSNKKSVDTVAIIACYNEIDIIESVIKTFILQNVNIHIIDNWSNDGTWELLLSIQKSYSSISIERYPKEQPSIIYDWKGLLARKEEVALGYPGFWVLHTDADEIRCSPWDDVPLPESLSIVDSYGCNAVDFTILNFRPVDEGFCAGMNPEEYFKYFELGNTSDLKYQIKCWKQGKERVDLQSRGGHFVILDEQNIFPIKFVCKHYPLRSKKHAIKKIVTDRRNRFSPQERALGWHSHYDDIESNSCIWNWKDLYEYTDVHSSNIGRYMIHGL
jgi:hypothetical protein